METTNYLNSKWKSSTKKVFWSIILISFAGIFSTIYDYLSYVANLIQMTSGMLSKLGSLGSDIPQIDLEGFVNWGFSSKGLVVIGYILYLWGLTAFASILQVEETARQIRKVRTAAILLALTFLLEIVFGFLSIIPFTEWIFKLIIWIMTLCCFYKMKHAYEKLMQADDFNERARRGARNLRYAAVCEIRLKWLPLITSIILVLIVAYCTILMTSTTSLDGVKKVASVLAIFVLIILLVVGIVAVCAMFCAFWWPIVGWYRIKTGEPVEELEAAGDSGVKAAPEAGQNVQNAATEIAEVPADSELPIAGGKKDASWFDKNKKWLFPFGGVVGLVLLIWGAVSIFSPHKNGNELLPVQLPTWEKFVVLTESDVLIFKEPNAGSPQLEVMSEDIESDAIFQCFKWSDTPNKRGYISDSYALYKDNVLPVVGEDEDWYRVVIANRELGAQEGYIRKKLCREVKPQPISPKLLLSLNSYDWQTANYGLQTEGEYENICFISVTEEGMYSPWLEVAVLYDGKLVNPLTKHIDTYADPDWNYSFRIEDRNGTKVMIYGETLLRDGVLDARTIALEEKVGEVNVALLFESIPTTTSTMQEVSYYFPELAQDRLYTFVHDLSGGTSSSRMDDMEDKKEFTGFSYFVESTEYGLELYAGVDGERKATDLYGGVVELTILAQGDYDGDGEKEAVVYGYGGGNIVEPPVLVYFDKESQEFKKAEGFQVATTTPKIEVEEWNGKPSFLMYVGLRKDRYTYEDHAVKLVDRLIPELGKVISSVTVEQIFGTSEADEDKATTMSINEKGEMAKIVFHHDTSHALDWGKSMRLVSITETAWTIPVNGQENLGVSGSKFSFLNSETNGIPDILCDDAWLYKWDGSEYVLWQPSPK